MRNPKATPSQTNYQRGLMHGLYFSSGLMWIATIILLIATHVQRHERREYVGGYYGGHRFPNCNVNRNVNRNIIRIVTEVLNNYAEDSERDQHMVLDLDGPFTTATLFRPSFIVPADEDLMESYYDKEHGFEIDYGFGDFNAVPAFGIEPNFPVVRPLR